MTGSARRDAYRALTTIAVLAVAAIAAVISFEHIEALAVRYGQPVLAAVLLPLSIDGTVAVSSMAMLRSARLGLTAPWLARSMLLLSVAATVACNVAFGLSHGLPGALLSGWPAVAFVGSAEVAISMSRTRTPRAPDTRGARRRRTGSAYSYPECTRAAYPYPGRTSDRHRRRIRVHGRTRRGRGAEHPPDTRPAAPWPGARSPGAGAPAHPHTRPLVPAPRPNRQERTRGQLTEMRFTIMAAPPVPDHDNRLALTAADAQTETRLGEGQPPGPAYVDVGDGRAQRKPTWPATSRFLGRFRAL